MLSFKSINHGELRLFDVLQEDSLHEGLWAFLLDVPHQRLKVSALVGLLQASNIFLQGHELYHSELSIKLLR